MSTAAGRPRAARSVPGGVSRMSAGTARADPGHPEHDERHDRPARQPRNEQPRARSEDDRQPDPPAHRGHGRGLAGRRLGGAFLAGIGLFAIGLIVGGLAPSMSVLVAARFVQGLGAGAIPPIAYVAIGRSLPERLRPQMFATLSTAWVLPGVIGPAIAGLVGETVGWRWVFLGLLPLIAVAGLIAYPAVSRSDRPPRRRPARPRPWPRCAAGSSWRSSSPPVPGCSSRV